ncbi:MAG TPA: class I SAM-dependent methyltransferase [Kofleriaceae bacterium]|nr:class I SAM-dependent methyltransferase [Kofleriaceae bacterium]
MLAEIAHLCRHAPATLALKYRLPQDELYATLIARADAAGLAAKRAELVAGLSGRVLELGCGTGSMFRHYRDVDVVAIEPDAAFAKHAHEAAQSASVAIEVLEGRGEAIPLPDASVDAAVVALVLCSVPDVDAVARELARVVRPGGALRLVEHVKSEHRVAGALMNALDPLWLRLNGQGCHMNRNPLPALERHGFAFDRVEPFQLWSAGMPAFPMLLAVGSRRDASPTTKHM